MFCSQCGARVTTRARYCEECGAAQRPALVRTGAAATRAIVTRRGDLSLAATAVWWLMAGVCGLIALFLFPAASLAMLIMGTGLWLALGNHQRGIAGCMGKVQRKGSSAVAERDRPERQATRLVCCGFVLAGVSLGSLWLALYMNHYYYWSYWDNPRQIALTLLFLGSLWIGDLLWIRFLSCGLPHDRQLLHE